MTRTACLTQVVAETLRASCGGPLAFERCIVAARGAISRAVVEGCDVDAVWRESDPDKRLPGHYRRHQVVTDPSGFTVVVLLWEPGAVTPIHDHDTWCVFGVLEGALEVTDYDVLEDDGRSPLLLAERGRDVLRAGLLGDNGAPGTEVHRVRNTGNERAMSLHVYGDDLTKRTLFGGRGIRVEGKTGGSAFDDRPAY